MRIRFDPVGPHAPPVPSHLRHKLGRAVAQRFQHGRGVGVEQGYAVGQFVVDLVLALRLETTREKTFRW